MAQTIPAVIVAVLVVIASLVVYRVLFGQDEVKAEMRSVIASLIGLVTVALAVFVCNLVAAPARIYEEQHQRTLRLEEQLRRLQTERHAIEGESARLRERNIDLVNQLPPPKLTTRPEQESLLKKKFERLGPHAVSIRYLNIHESSAGIFAWQLANLFRSALWHVEIRGELAGYEHYVGLWMNVEDPRHIRGTQQDVLDAFKEAGVRCGLQPGRNVADRVELIVGAQ